MAWKLHALSVQGAHSARTLSLRRQFADASIRRKHRKQAKAGVEAGVGVAAGARAEVKVGAGAHFACKWRTRTLKRMEQKSTRHAGEQIMCINLSNMTESEQECYKKG